MRLLCALMLLFCSHELLAQDGESEELFEGPIYQEYTEDDVKSIMVALERRVFVPPIVGNEGVAFTLGLNYKSTPLVTTSEVAGELAGLIPLVPSPELGLDWTTERQRIFIHGFYIPYADLPISPIDGGFYWVAFGQDLLLAATGKEGRGLIFSYRFSYSAWEITRQFSVEDTARLAFWTSSSFASEVTLGYRMNEYDITIWAAGGSVNNSAEEADFRHNKVINLQNTNSYGGGGINFCFRDATVCTHFEAHVDVEQNFTYGGSLVLRK